MTTALIDVPRGLAGVAVTTTTVGDVRGEEGYYHYRGRSAVDLAAGSTFEDVWRLVLDDDPGRPDRSLPASLAPLVGQLDLRSGLSALCAALGLQPLMDISPDERHRNAHRLIAALPTLTGCASTAPTTGHEVLWSALDVADGVLQQHLWCTVAGLSWLGC